MPVHLCILLITIIHSFHKIAKYYFTMKLKTVKSHVVAITKKFNWNEYTQSLSLLCESISVTYFMQIFWLEFALTTYYYAELTELTTIWKETFSFLLFLSSFVLQKTKETKMGFQSKKKTVDIMQIQSILMRLYKH